jgi:hypothetical protein
MTEAEWLNAPDPTPMLGFLAGHASDRKLRLFACACCRRIWRSFTDERSRRAIEVAERFADGGAALAELDAACESARQAAWEVYSDVGRQAAWATTWRLLFPETPGDPEQDSGVVRAVEFATREVGSGGRAREAALEYQAQAAFLRDLVGNPFRPVALDPAWLTPEVVHRAQSIYDDRAFEHLPVLADALEDAGCHEADILAHCRGPGPHVRGCWAIDHILGKE